MVDGVLVAENGEYRYPVVDGVPVLRTHDLNVTKVPESHQSNPVSPVILEKVRQAEGLVLNIGGGATPIPDEKVVQFEYQIFSVTEVVGDAHALPFADDTFALVIGLNVFEHLRNPFKAAEEIRRVLAPGGESFIHTAFLQPLHEAPVHFYNATEFGIRGWFKRFENVDCRVSANFNPLYNLSWISSDLIFEVERSLGGEAAAYLSTLTLQQLSSFWRTGTTHDSRLQELFLSLPDHVQRRFAGGFECSAFKAAATTRGVLASESATTS